ncbi:hypothetical protein D6853_10095 [Butyrivibrio sp. X503]|uniref:hypothetical protein n=1 Tax=Butyrivibrio sp. X503 TaxID=2364878 RepID=UPI000EA9D110|nr:hypothetical protein [Butyrivibrio sp. X503]RKM55888.1 hypothetical protein D6853_10095 [Butyrivibrio sp. X503]
MRRRGLKIFAGIAAGMLAVTGLAGAVTKAQVQGIETVECKIESNYSSLTSCEEKAGTTRGETDFSEIWEVTEWAPHANNSDGFALIYVKGFDGAVLVSKQHDDDADKKDGGQYWFFTRKNGEKKVRCAGFLSTDLDLRYKDGIIYACNAEDNDYHIEESYETYLISPDGKRLIHKDYVNDDLWGFTNDSNIESNQVAFEGDYDDYVALWENYYNADVVKIGSYTGK